MCTKKSLKYQAVSISFFSFPAYFALFILLLFVNLATLESLENSIHIYLRQVFAVLGYTLSFFLELPLTALLSGLSVSWFIVHRLRWMVHMLLLVLADYNRLWLAVKYQMLLIKLEAKVAIIGTGVRLCLVFGAGI